MKSFKIKYSCRLFLICLYWINVDVKDKIQIYRVNLHGSSNTTVVTVILKHQLVRNQFLLISLMCHQHHQWNELVCLKQNQVCIHCPSFLNEHFSSTKRGRNREKGGGGVKQGGGLQWRWKRRENVWQSQNLPLHWDMIGFFPLCKNNKKIKTKTQKWCSKNEDERGRGGFLAGMCVALCIFFCSVKPR